MSQSPADALGPDPASVHDAGRTGLGAGTVGAAGLPGPNGQCSDAQGADGQGGSGLAPDGLATDGLAPDGLAPDGQGAGGLAPGGLAPDGQATDGLASGGQAAGSERRTDLIETARTHWASALTDLGGRNTLLYFKDRRSGTLDLAQADPAALTHFVDTGSIRLTRL